jgi:hypothetical protein
LHIALVNYPFMLSAEYFSKNLRVNSRKIIPTS